MSVVTLPKEVRIRSSCCRCLIHAFFDDACFERHHRCDYKDPTSIPEHSHMQLCCRTFDADKHKIV